MSNIRSYFTSRFGDDGYILEADLSQIEVVDLAFLSNDRQMKQDVRDGVDFHCKRLAYKLSMPYEEVVSAIKYKDVRMTKLRKDIKQFSFQRAYGAGPLAIAEGLGVQIDEIKALIKQEEKTYPGVAVFNAECEQQVLDTRIVDTSLRSPSGYPVGVGRINSITSRIYKCREYEKYNRYSQTNEMNFSQPDIKNYPIQGFAGETMKEILGHTVRELKKIKEWRGKVFLTMTVHDSIVMDIHKDCVEEVTIWIKDIMENADTYLNDRFNILFDLPIRATVSIGKDWMNQEEVL